MNKIRNLLQAKLNKNDEFYTRLEDIEAELEGYQSHFEGKIILCNCDNPDWSNFWVYFHHHFSRLKLKKLVSTHYSKDGGLSYKTEYTGGNDADVRDWKQTQLKGDGDFRSEECVAILQEADIIVTNPPFSLFRSYISQLMEHKKEFVIIGPQNAITYKEFFPLLKNNEVWLGYNHVKEFIKPDGTTQEFGNICWYTNLDIPKRRVSLVEQLTCQFKQHPEWYPKYDNYDAINVGYVGNDFDLQRRTNRVDHIPYDYFGVMGVPITFVDKYNPDEFEIVGLAPERNREGSVLQHKKYLNAVQHNDPKKIIEGKKKEIEPGGKVNDGPVILLNDKPLRYPYYSCPTEPDKYLQVLYARILIRRKKSD